jgi:hypothetical protein
MLFLAKYVLRNSNALRTSSSAEINPSSSAEYTLVYTGIGDLCSGVSAATSSI